MRLLKWLRSLLRKPARKTDARPWKVDREGQCYLPERKVVLKAKRGPENA